MISEIRRLLDARPFQPFSVVMSSGQSYAIASGDHASINPTQTWLFIYFDDGTWVSVSPIHIVAISHEALSAAL